MKLNLGSGQRKFCARAGWLNCDSQEKWAPDLRFDMRQGLPWADPEAELVVLHHVLEHFDCTDGPALLKECWRVLLPGGSLLVFVPDLVALARRWLDGGLTDYLYTVNLMGAYLGDEADRHKWGYCYRSLHEALRAAGEWKEIKPFDYRHVAGADLAQDFWILAVEAVKS